MPKPSLYDVDLTGATFRTRCGSENPGSSDPTQDSCIEFAEIPEYPGAFALRDTKLGERSPTLRFDASEIAAFVRAHTS